MKRGQNSKEIAILGFVLESAMDVVLLLNFGKERTALGSRLMRFETSFGSVALQCR